MKRFLKAAAVAFPLVVLPLAVVLRRERFRREPDAAGGELGEPRSPRFRATRTGTTRCSALGAPDGADPHVSPAHGSTRRALRRGRIGRNKPARQSVRSAPSLRRRADFVPRGGEGQADDVKAQLDAYQEDLARYETLIGYKRYEEVLDFPLRVSTQLSAVRSRYWRAPRLRAARSACGGAR
jgi:hypothetical protein